MCYFDCDLIKLYVCVPFVNTVHSVSVSECVCVCVVDGRSVGGLRVSLYNAVTLEDVKQLVKFMDDFRLNNSKITDN